MTSQRTVERHSGERNPRVRRRLWWARGIAVGATVLGIVTFIVSLDDAGSIATVANHFAEYVLWAPLFAWLGTLIISRHVAERIGWLFIVIGGGSAMSSLVEVEWQRLGSISEITNVGTWLLLWLSGWFWMVGILAVLLLFYVFPTGALLSWRWRWAPIVMVVLVAATMFFTTVGESFETYDPTGSNPSSVPNPIGVLQDSWPLIGIPWLAGLLSIVLGGIVALVVRFRRSDEVGRAQLKWVLAAATLFLSAMALSLVLGEGTHVTDVIATIGLASIPLAITVAVLRYRLFDIDVIISRSLTFGVLVGFIGLVYVGIVVGVSRLFGSELDASFGLSVVATAIVAMLFQPVRVRVERWANRVVYGKRATPYEVLARFSHRATEESDEGVLGRIPRLIVDGTGAAQATVWIATSRGFRAASWWPETESARRLTGGDGGFVDPDADVSLPVFHDGELLGGVSLVAARGGSITPPEQELVDNLADGLGLTLRNTRLTAALRRQVKDLQRSRDRVMSAADEARRSLEHDLDSGPQQQLVAVKVKLGPARKLAEQLEASGTARLLGDIENQAADAIKAVRDFASGIYPPLLGAEGLAVALGQEANKAALPVDVVTDGITRYPRDVESAVYFTVLEALQNTAKYANATHATVTLTETNGDLQFEIRDNGDGFDPTTITRGAGLNGIGDRIDTIGGTWTLHTTPGEGTTITATIPVREAPPTA